MTEYTGFEKAEVVSPRKQNVRNITKSGPGGSEHGTLNESKQQSKDGKVVNRGASGRRQLRVQDYAKPKYAGAFVNKTHRYARRKKWSGVKRAGLGRVARTSLEGGVLPSSYGPEAN